MTQDLTNTRSALADIIDDIVRDRRPAVHTPADDLRDSCTIAAGELLADIVRELSDDALADAVHELTAGESFSFADIADELPADIGTDGVHEHADALVPVYNAGAIATAAAVWPDVDEDDVHELTAGEALTFPRMAQVICYVFARQTIADELDALSERLADIIADGETIAVRATETAFMLDGARGWRIVGDYVTEAAALLADETGDDPLTDGDRATLAVYDSGDPDAGADDTADVGQAVHELADECEAALSDAGWCTSWDDGVHVYRLT